jgi:hypothetical protein
MQHKNLFFQLYSKGRGTPAFGVELRLHLLLELRLKKNLLKIYSFDFFFLPLPSKFFGVAFCCFLKEVGFPI